MKESNAILLFENGTKFHGQSIGIDGIKSGEVVFNTSMTGYQEILTDPSYHSQIINFTNPHIGNTGINDEDIESNQIHVSGMIIRDLEIQASSWRKTSTLSEYLVKNKVIGISEISKFLDVNQNIDTTKEQISIKTRQYAKRQRTWARNQMVDWEKVDYKKLSSFLKKIKISSLKLDQ